MEAKYITEWDTSDGESISITSIAEVDLEKGTGKIIDYETEMDKKWGTEWADKLERQLDEYFLVGNKKHTAVEKSFIGGYSEDDQRKFLKENDYYHNGAIVYERFD